MSDSSLPEMTSRERVLAALAGKPVDRTPACTPTSVATVELMDLANAPFPDANRRPQLMADLAMTAYTELGFDTVMPVFSIIQESSAIGCKMQWKKKDNWPTVRMSEPVWFQPEDIRYRREMTVDYAIMQFEAGADAITLPDHQWRDLGV